MGYHSPRVPTSFSHILCKICEHTYLQKGLVGTRGGGGREWCFKNIFLFPICIIQKVTIWAPKLSRAFMETEIQMQNYKVETNSELIYEDGSIWSTLIFIKIIGSYTLWFPLPPSEVLLWWAIIFVIKSHLELPEKNIKCPNRGFGVLSNSHGLCFWLSNPHGIPLSGYGNIDRCTSIGDS